MEDYKFKKGDKVRVTELVKEKSREYNWRDLLDNCVDKEFVLYEEDTQPDATERCWTAEDNSVYDCAIPESCLELVSRENEESVDVYIKEVNLDDAKFDIGEKVIIKGSIKYDPNIDSLTQTLVGNRVEISGRSKDRLPMHREEFINYTINLGKGKDGEDLKTLIPEKHLEATISNEKELCKSLKEEIAEDTYDTSNPDDELKMNSVEFHQTIEDNPAEDMKDYTVTTDAEDPGTKILEETLEDVKGMTKDEYEELYEKATEEKLLNADEVKEALDEDRATHPPIIPTKTTAEYLVENDTRKAYIYFENDKYTRLSVVNDELCPLSYSDRADLTFLKKVIETIEQVEEQIKRGEQ
jgi:hypothetical protein